jgi:transposase
MKLAKIFVGVDVSKDNLDIFFRPLNHHFRARNDINGLSEILKKLSEYDPIRIVCESSGGYEKLLIRTLSQAGYPIWLVEPKRIKSFIASDGIKAKTDKIDASMIALFAQQKELPEQIRIKIPKKNEELLKALVRRKNDLMGIIVREKTRLAHPQVEFCLDKIQQHIDFMTDQIKELEKEIEQLIDNDDDWKHKQEIITSIPGAGKGTANTLISFFTELGSIGNKQVAALLGVAPYTNESGNFKKKSVVKEGRPIPRKMLYMPTLSAIQHNQDFKIFYNRLRQEGKPPKVAIIAVMRKFIILANILVAENRLWSPNKNGYST